MPSLMGKATTSITNLMPRTKPKPGPLRAFKVEVSDQESHGISFATSAAKARYHTFLTVKDDQVCSPLPMGGYTPWRFLSFADIRVRRAPDYDHLVPFVPADEVWHGSTPCWTTEYVLRLPDAARRA